MNRRNISKSEAGKLKLVSQLVYCWRWSQCVNAEEKYLQNRNWSIGAVVPAGLLMKMELKYVYMWWIGWVFAKLKLVCRSWCTSWSAAEDRAKVCVHVMNRRSLCQTQTGVKELVYQLVYCWRRSQRGYMWGILTTRPQPLPWADLVKTCRYL
jgi:hypothetical protein